MTTLVNHPYAPLAKDFIMQYRKKFVAVADVIEILPVSMK